MTNPDLVHYILIIDRSGSMQAIQKDTQGGIRAFVDKQLEGVDPAKRTVSLYQFDTEHDTVLDWAPLADARDYKLQPRGGTALLDACGFAIKREGEKLAAMSEEDRPGYVMVVIATDGEENSSKEYKRDAIKKMITHQQDTYDWRFTYLGANQDAFAEAGSIGIAAASAMNFRATGQSVTDLFYCAAASVSAGTAPTSTGIYYTDAQRDQVAGKK